MIYVNPIEGFYLAVNVVAFLLTLWNLREAQRDGIAVRRINGHARNIATKGDFRREVLRLTMLVCLMGVALPGVFVDREITLTPSLALLIAVPCIILIQSALDARERRQLIRAVIKDAEA